MPRHRRSEGVLKPFQGVLPYQSEKGRCTALYVASRGKPDFRLVALRPPFLQSATANRKETNTMSKKLLLALAACLPIALSGCGGGGGASSSPAAQSPSVESGTQTPTAALDAAKTAVDNANSAKTEAAVQRAIRALSAAVETAETAKTTAQAALTEAQAALTEAQDYRTAQAAILDGLQPVGASASLAAVVPASATLALEARRALAEAKIAMAAARNDRTEAAISRARRALSEAVQKARESFDAATAVVHLAETDLTAARNYRNEQTPLLNSIPFTRQPGAPPEQPSSPPGEFNVTHVELSTRYSTWSSGGRPFQYAPRGGTFAPFGESYWRNVRNDASGLKNGFRRFADVNGITMAEKNFNQPISYGTRSDGLSDRERILVDRVRGGIQQGHSLDGVLHFNNHIVGIGSYSAFDVVRLFHRCTTTPGFCGSTGRDLYDDGFSVAFGERSVRAPGWTRPGLNPQTNLRFVYRGAVAGVKHRERGKAFTGTATLTYRPNIAGDTINLLLREYRGQGIYGPWSHEADMSPNNDGSFSDATNSVKGDFYGPNWDEAAGIVQTRDVYGGWLVHRPFEFQGESSFGPVLGQHTGPPFALNDFIQ